MASHLAGGTHHAHYDRGSGVCIFNDLAVSARYLVTEGLASRVLIFDCDVHQGDGTASILAHDSQTFTCSIHAEKNFPVRKVESDLDVNCPDGMTDDAYLSLIFETLSRFYELASRFCFAMLEVMYTMMLWDGSRSLQTVVSA